MRATPAAADLEDIQGLVYNGWSDHPYAGYLFATLGDPARSRAWLHAIRHRVTPASCHKLAPGGRFQVALSPHGLEMLGVPAEALAGLPQEAKHGMASRARILGDDEPTGWELGKNPEELDVLVMVFERDPEARAAALAEHRRSLEAAGARVRDDELGWPLGRNEHFGFADGISQPFLPGREEPPRPGQDAIAAGEILLGYRNAYGKLPTSPHWHDFDLGHNGTYLVFRKLHQHVATFWGYLADRARELAPDPAAAAALTEQLAAKLMGRWKSGAPLVLTPDRDDPALATIERNNSFGYLQLDPHGLRCPMSSHVRRANPRDARGGSASSSQTVVSRHRILRRGRSYGPPLADADALAGKDDRQPRGLYFICLQASIARGFEFIQQTWLSNPGFLGLFNEPDPIMGNGDGTAHVTIPASPVRLRLANMPIVVTVLGGGYFFLPSLAALARIAAPA